MEREHTATVSCPNYECSSSSFLGNGKMEREERKPVTKGVATRNGLDFVI